MRDNWSYKKKSKPKRRKRKIGRLGLGLLDDLFPGQQDKHICCPSPRAPPWPSSPFPPGPGVSVPVRAFSGLRSPPPATAASQLGKAIRPPPSTALTARGRSNAEAVHPSRVIVMPGLAAAEQDAVSLVRRVARALNRRFTDIVALLFSHKVKAKPVPLARPCARAPNPSY